MVESSLDSSLFGGNLGGPTDGDWRERLGDEEAVPGAELPGSFGVNIKSTYGGVGKFGQLGNARFSDPGGAAGAVGGDGAVVSAKIRAVEVAEACGAVA